MAPIRAPVSSSKKRKAASDAKAIPKAKRRREGTAGSTSELDVRLSELENGLSKTQGGKSQLLELFSMFDLAIPDSERNLKVAICLCRIFSRFMAAGQFPWSKSNQEDQWQMKGYSSYQFTLQQFVRMGHGPTPTAMLKLHMRMLKEESAHNPDSAQIFGSFSGLVSSLFEAADGTEARKTFAEDYLQQYQDCCFYSLEAIK